MTFTMIIMMEKVNINPKRTNFKEGAKYRAFHLDRHRQRLNSCVLTAHGDKLYDKEMYYRMEKENERYGFEVAEKL